MNEDSSIEDKNFCLYVHVNKTNGKQYCGITSQDPQKRWRNGNGYPRNKYFNSAIQKYGWDGFEHRILLDGLDYYEACDAERQYIAYHNLTDRQYGYNQTIGGEGIVGIEYTDELRKKISESHKGRITSDETKKLISKKNSGTNNGMYGRTPWNKGKPMPEDSRKKVSQNRTGKTAGKDHPMYGKHHTAAAKQKMSNAHKGYTPWNKGLHTGILPPNSRPVQMIADGNVIKTFESLCAAASYVNGHPSCIGMCCRGKQKTSYGYEWRYVQ